MLPNPFDPIEEEISRMVNEGGREPTLPDTVREALESFEWLNKGGAAPSVVIKTDGNHISDSWEKPSQKKP